MAGMFSNKFDVQSTLDATLFSEAYKVGQLDSYGVGQMAAYQDGMMGSPFEAALSDKFSPEMKTNLNQLVKLWNKNEDANIEYYFTMKEHHSFINGKIENVTLKTMWNDYLKCGLEFRVDLLKLNDLCKQLY